MNPKPRVALKKFFSLPTNHPPPPPNQIKVYHTSLEQKLSYSDMHLLSKSFKDAVLSWVSENGTV